jgi:uncharacterized protein YjdB
MKMTKKMMFLCLLFPMVLGTADLYAQVTIGSDNPPHPGAILDLQSTGTDKGLKLPSVSLLDTAVFQLSTNSSDAASARGMTVYNTNDDIIGGRGQGIYTWNGTWIYSGGAPKADTLVSRISITSEGNIPAVKAGETLKLTAYILPENASNKKVAWSVPWSSSVTDGKAVVNDTGLVTGIKPGSVKVRASAIDGSTASRDFDLTVKPNGQAKGISVYSENGQYSIEVGNTLQLMVAITPDSARQSVKWEVEGGSTTIATVGAYGLVTGIGTGTVDINAITLDGTLLQASRQIEILSASLPTEIDYVEFPSTNQYRYYDFNGTTWMIDYAMEAGASATEYGGLEANIVVNYYNRAVSKTICPAGWSLPTKLQIESLVAYLKGGASASERQAWVDAGPSGTNSGSWMYPNYVCGWTSDDAIYWSSRTSGQPYGTQPAWLAPVRCVRD